jgi:predicted nucleic acid-binding Zn ribbon protein
MEAHKHCIGCGVNIPLPEFFCSQKCKDSFIEQRKKRMKFQRIVLVILIIIFVSMLIIRILKGA